MGLLETTSSFNKKMEQSYKDVHFKYENQLLSLHKDHRERLQKTVDIYESKLLDSRLRIEKLSNENERLKSDKKLITKDFEKKKIELLESENERDKAKLIHNNSMRLKEFESFQSLKKLILMHFNA